jgi:hypothetical protein
MEAPALASRRADWRHGDSNPGALEKFVQGIRGIKDWPCGDSDNDGKEQRFDRKLPTPLVRKVVAR